jgi:hypothetical protein
MKGVRKGVFLLVLLLIGLSSIVSAEIIVNGPEQTSVNIGDDISLNGYVIVNDDVLGLLKFELNCADYNSILMIRSISLNAGIKKDFLEEFAILSVDDGSCTVNVILESEGEKLESKSSSNFKVTKELTGSFSIDKESLQVGDKVKVKGTSFGQDGEAVEGYGIVSLKKEGVAYFSDNFDVKNGVVDYVIDTSDVPGGEYEVEIEVREGFGNFILESIGKFRLISSIDVNAHSSKVHYLPKEKVRIEGTASVLGGKLKQGTVYVTMNDDSYSEEFKNGNFVVNFYLLNVIQSGKHDLELRVEDEFGNFGLYDFSIIVDPIPTTLTVVTDKEAINPGASIAIKAFLNDQAGDLIGESITIKVVDDKGEVFFDGVKKSGEQFDVVFGENVKPGNYFVKASYGDVLGEKLFVIGRVLLLDYSIVGQELVVENIGNIPYEGLLQIEISGNNVKSISREINLGVKQEFRIDLGVGMSSGLYKVSVNEEVFENVEIIGIEEVNYWWLIYVAIVLLFLLWYYYWLKSGKRFNKRIKKSIHTGRIVHSNKKHGEFGGAPMSRINSEGDHVKKFKDYMGRAVSFKKERKIKGLGRKKDRGNVYGIFGKRKKVSENISSSNVFSGVGSGWSRENVEKVEKYSGSETKKEKKDKEEPKSSWFNMFD